MDNSEDLGLSFGFGVQDVDVSIPDVTFDLLKERTSTSRDLEMLGIGLGKNCEHSLNISRTSTFSERYSNDIKDESLQVLKSQLEKVKEIRVHSHKKDLQLRDLKRKVSDLERVNCDLRVELQGLREELSVAHSNLESSHVFERQLEAKAIGLKNLEDRLSDARKQIQRVEHERTVAQKERDLALESRMSLEKTLSEEMRVRDDSIRGLQAEKERVYLEMDKLKDRINDKDAERQGAECLFATQKKQILSERDEARLQVEQLRDKIAEMQTEVVQFQNVNNKCLDTSRKLEAALESIQGQQVVITERDSRISTLLGELRELDGVCVKAKETQMLVEERCRGLEEKGALLVSNMESLRVRLERCEQELASTKNDLVESRNRVVDRESKIEHLSEAVKRVDVLENEITTWKRGARCLHHKITNQCTKELGEDTVTPHENFTHVAPDHPLCGIFSSLDSLERLHIQNLNRVRSELADSTQKLEGRIRQLDDENVRLREDLSRFGSDLGQAEHAACTLHHELEEERRLNEKTFDSIRGRFLQVLSESGEEVGSQPHLDDVLHSVVSRIGHDGGWKKLCMLLLRMYGSVLDQLVKYYRERRALELLCDGEKEVKRLTRSLRVVVFFIIGVNRFRRPSPVLVGDRFRMDLGFASIFMPTKDVFPVSKITERILPVAHDSDRVQVINRLFGSILKVDVVPWAPPPTASNRPCNIKKKKKSTRFAPELATVFPVTPELRLSEHVRGESLESRLARLRETKYQAEVELECALQELEAEYSK
mmetsp:Transcript_19695/g.32810  ORF Transcript_19695/g.32810 Transcript_19695/m.32810 type:complete len:772 (+) Transcript_19695:78-2393(+)